LEQALSKLIQTQLEPDGLLMATINMQDRTMNVFSFDLMDALDELMDLVDHNNEVKAVVLTSGKASFLAGADLVMVRGFCTEARTASHDSMFEQCGRLGRQFVRLENSPKPWVAAVNGLALGGGLEITLACRERIVSDDKRIQLGVPEIRWGLLPGAGGTQRLPRMVGFEKGMNLLLTGRSMTPQEAVESGLYREAVPAAQLLDKARSLARELVGTPYDAAKKFPHLDQSKVPAYSDATARKVATHFKISEEDFKLYPAFSAIVDSVLKGAGQSLTEATTTEMNEFLRLMFNPVAGRMVRTLFLGKVRVERELAPTAEVQIQSIQTGPLSPSLQQWDVLFSKLKLPVSNSANVPLNHLDITDTQGMMHRVQLDTIQGITHVTKGLNAAVLCNAGPYGRLIEIVGDSNQPAANIMASLAIKMWALPWPSNSKTSLMQSLKDLPLNKQATHAMLWAAENDISDISYLDVAACLAGVSAGWTGGPLSWFWDEQESQVTLLNAAELEVWHSIKPQLAKACE
jgi:3-hydroxyacyl-CoA dehydrogenase/enoyl-CoA hydratase/3-hydroxybutyryl-CoA epimerase